MPTVVPHVWQAHWPSAPDLASVVHLRQRVATIVAPRPNPERPAEVVAALALEVVVEATVHGCLDATERARLAVLVRLPDQSEQLVWPRPEQWTSSSLSGSGGGGSIGGGEGDGPWRLVVPVYIVQPTWTDAAVVRLDVVYVPPSPLAAAERDVAVPISTTSVAYSVVPKAVAPADRAWL